MFRLRKRLPANCGDHTPLLTLSQRRQPINGLAQL